MAPSFYWHDYETFGVDPSKDRPVQFAGLRTDQHLNIVGEPLVLYCRPASDVLPQPQACLVTGITPQKALAEGVPECQFINQIHQQLSQPGTCGVGYNSLRFDDEVTRYTLYRNFFDPYAREWQNGNSRWDIIDMVRTAYALRPEGINWPTREDGMPSFRLQDLTEANQISHQDAHDALSDVHATIAVAQLLRDKQPRLFDYLFKTRGKRAVIDLLDMTSMKPVLHVSGMFGAKRHNIALIVPLAVHPNNSNEIICYDLMVDPTPLFEETPELLAELLYTRSEELPRDKQRPGLKSVHINKCPVLVPAKMADPPTAERLGIDGKLCRKHLALLREQRGRDSAAFSARLEAICQAREYPDITNPDRMLYSGGFFSDHDRRLMDQVRQSSPEGLADASLPFADERLPDMLFRYRARNFPETLTEQEREVWQAHRFAYLTEPSAGASICLEDYNETIEALLAQEPDERDRSLLQELLVYGDQLLSC